MNSRSDKYSGHDDLFDEEHGVLRNRLGITDAEELGVAENECLIRAYGAALAGYDEGHRFDEEDVRHLHRLFLGPVFEWAGTYRRVDISSPGIRYCHAAYIGDNMKAFSKRLAALTPFSEGMGKEEVVKRLAEIHAELIVIHPFRDGNGRTTRLLCDLLLAQAGRKAMDTAAFYDGAFMQKYHAAIRQAWHTGGYSGLEALFYRLLAD